MKNVLAFPQLLERFQHGRRPRPPRQLPGITKEPMGIEAPDPNVVRSYRNFSKWAGIIAMVVGYHVLMGWLFSISVLKSPSENYATMKATAAICSLVAGIALYFIQTERECLRKKRTPVVAICAALMGFLGLITLAEHSFGWRIGVNGWFTLGTDTTEAGPMAITSAFAFLMIAAALVLVDGAQIYRWAEGLCLGSAAIALLAIAGYLYQAPAFEWQMPLYAAVVIFFLSAGILCARADRGFMSKITSDSFGGIMARRLLPATLIIPIVLGWFQQQGYKFGLYSTEPGLALFAMANVAAFLFVVWWGVSSLHRMEIRRRQAENELKETAAKLARSNADLEQFAYVASHDLKEPLRAISGSVQILQERYRDELGHDANEVIKHTVDGATRMQRLIDDLLTYSRLTTREAPLAPTDFNQVVLEVLANLEALIKENKAVVTNDPLPVVDADRVQILQVFQNLISNGIKYRSERTPKIHVSVESRDSEWVFSVRDNGIGIAPQYAERIFRIFQRLHTRKEYSGTGIGLAVCKKIVERHGGRIWIESEPEEGSTFFFTIPK
jgi:signal transduction histidine kinase